MTDRLGRSVCLWQHYTGIPVISHILIFWVQFKKLYHSKIIWSLCMFRERGTEVVTERWNSEIICEWQKVTRFVGTSWNYRTVKKSTNSSFSAFEYRSLEEEGELYKCHVWKFRFNELKKRLHRKMRNETRKSRKREQTHRLHVAFVLVTSLEIPTKPNFNQSSNK